MKLYSQRDKRWGEKYLGFSKTTKIKNWGCTLTCLAMIAETQPGEMNERLKNAKAFQNNLVIWSKVPGFKFHQRIRIYNNQQVKEAIKKYGFCLVEVDFDNKLETARDRHWVVFIGNHQILDPWTGKKASTDKYKILTGFCVLEYIKSTPNRGNMSDLQKQLQACLKDRETFWKERDQAIEEKAKLEDKWKQEKEGLEKQISELKILESGLKLEISVKNTEIKELKSQTKKNIADSDELRRWLAEKLGTVGQWGAIKGEVEKLVKIEDEKNNQIKTLASVFEEFKKNQPIIKEKGGEKMNLKKALWEATKEPLRWLVLAILPVLATYLAKIDGQWALYATVVLRMIDKTLHEVSKANPKAKVVKLPF